MTLHENTLWTVNNRTLVCLKVSIDIYVYSLCSCQGDIHHYHVIQSEKGYYVESWQQHEMKYFKSLEDMIHFYKDPDRGLQWPLTCPIINNDVQEEDDDSGECF